MPTISVFLGLTVRMYYDDHAPPHFHVYYGDAEAQIAIETRAVLRGRLPKRALNLALEWAEQHHDELMDNWNRAARHEPLDLIAGLE
jgi:Domain of unknown function (DUF4160)